MSKPRHTLTLVDQEARTGTCAVCGTVKLWRKKRPDGTHRWACSVSQGRWRGGRLRNGRGGARDPFAPGYLRHRLGVTPEVWDRMLQEQEYRCPICETDLRLLDNHKRHLDHDHATDKVRGILCARCNAILGYIHDSPAIARRAAAYLDGQNASA